MFDNDVYNEILNNKKIKNISKYINDDKNYSFENLKYFDYIKYNSKVNLNKTNIFNRNSLNNNNNKINNSTNFSINNNSNNNNNFKKTHISNLPKLINKNYNKISLFNLKKNLTNNSTNFSFKSKQNNNNKIKNFTFDSKIKNLTFDSKNKNFTFDSKDSTIPDISSTKAKKNDIRKKILILDKSENSEINNNFSNNIYTNQTLNLTTSNRNFSSKCDEIINDCKFHINKINLKQNLNIDPYQLRKLENKYKSIKYSNNKNEDVIFQEKNKKINLYLEDINVIRTDKKYYKKTLKKCLLMNKQFKGINNLDNKFAFKSKNFCKEIFGVEKSEIEKHKESDNKIKNFRERNNKKIKEMNDLLEKNEKSYYKIHHMFDNIIKKQKIEKEKIEKFLKIRNNNDY